MRSIREIIRSRRSCRAYLPEPLPRETIEQLITDAVWSPSGSNNQPWRFAVIQGKEALRRYSDLAKRGLLERLDELPHLQQYEQYLRDPDFSIFYDAPALVVIYGNRSSRWRVNDCTMVAYNLMLLAEDAGLGTCWIGFSHDLLDLEAVKQELEIPLEYDLVAAILLGRPDPGKVGAPPARKPFTTRFVGG